MFAILTALALGLLPVDDVLADRADIIEFNHMYDAEGRLVFEQLIFWDWRLEDERFHVFAWRLVKSPTQWPRQDWRRGGYFVRWLDGDYLREVWAVEFRESWTQYDPELLDRDELPQSYRRELRKQ